LELTKRYDRADFKDDETCVGYAVDVFQDSINKTFREYLVNYTYLTRILENYGFVLASPEDLRNLRAEFTASTGFFGDLFNKMNDEIKQNPQVRASYKDAPLMTDGERTISFLNRYFIYKKVRKVSDAEKVALNLQHKTADEVMDEARGSLTAKQAVSKALASETLASEVAPLAVPATVVKTRTIKPKTIAQKPKLSTIGENTPTVEPSQAAQVQASAAPPENVYAISEPPVKKPVKSLKRTLKVTENKITQ
jgi:hypothetical protein